MPKIGILSMQRIANYGSFLQAYGLKSILEELGCEVEFVDYHPGKTLLPSDGGTGLKRKISKVMEVFHYSAPLKEKLKFIKYKKNYAANYYPYLGIENEMNYSTDYDLLIIGSDEVFNCVQNNTNVGFSPDLFGQNCEAKKLISYAASFGNTTLDKLKEFNVDEKVGSWLNKFDAISVRDENSGFIVESLLNRKPFYNLDPVLIYDYLGKCKSISDYVPAEKYMILYGYAGRFSKDECKKIKAFAREKDLKIYCIGGVQDACDKFIDVDPFKVISYFKSAEYVITDTFHGTIMSVISNRQFASVVRYSGYGNSEKLIDLLKRLGLTDRIADKIENVPNLLEKKINYEQINLLLEEQREKSYSYLKGQIIGE